MGKDRVWNNLDYTGREMTDKIKTGDGRCAIGYGFFSIAHCLLPIACFILWGCGGRQIIITKDPLSAEEHIKLGQAYEVKGELELAIHEYEKVLEKDNTNCMGYFGIGNIYYKKGKLSDAETHYKKAIEHTNAEDPKSALFYNNLSWVYIEGNGNLKEAETLAQRAISLDPLMSFVYLDTLGVVYTRLGEFEKAEEAFLSALKSAPDDKTALRHINIHLFELYRINGNAEKMQEVVQRLQGLSK